MCVCVYVCMGGVHACVHVRHSDSVHVLILSDINTKILESYSQPTDEKQSPSMLRETKIVSITHNSMLSV